MCLDMFVLLLLSICLQVASLRYKFPQPHMAQRWHADDCKWRPASFHMVSRCLDMTQKDAKKTPSCFQNGAQARQKLSNDHCLDSLNSIWSKDDLMTAANGLWLASTGSQEGSKMTHKDASNQSTVNLQLIGTDAMLCCIWVKTFLWWTQSNMLLTYVHAAWHWQYAMLATYMCTCYSQDGGGRWPQGKKEERGGMPGS